MMNASKKPFKQPPKKYHPKGLSILYEDRDLVVVDKVCGLLTVSNEKVRENTAYYLLNDYVRKGNQKSPHRVFIVHRLDRDTSGILVFAKSEKAKNFLQDQWQTFQKTYLALVHGKLPAQSGTLSSYLAENQAHRMYAVHNPEKGKLAKTGYQVLYVTKKYSLLEIDLLTGRKNQIRVHLADVGCPVAGDKKYGIPSKAVKRLMLHASSLTFVHPHSKDPLAFATRLPLPFDVFMKGGRVINIPRFECLVQPSKRA